MTIEEEAQRRHGAASSVSIGVLDFLHSSVRLDAKGDPSTSLVLQNNLYAIDGRICSSGVDRSCRRIVVGRGRRAVVDRSSRIAGGVCVGTVCRSRSVVLDTRYGGALVAGGRLVLHGWSRRPVGTLVVLLHGIAVMWYVKV
jgi:hypothetical protein